MSEKASTVRCQCTLASEIQIMEIFRKFAANNPSRDICYDDVNEGVNEIGRGNNAVDETRYGSGERQCFGCDPLLHMLVKRFNESGYDPNSLFLKPIRRGGRKAKREGLCDVAVSRDYTVVNDTVPDLRGSPIKAPNKK